MNLQTKCPASRLVNEDNFNWIAMSMSSMPKEGPAYPWLKLRSRAITDLESCWEKLQQTWLGLLVVNLNLRQGRIIQVVCRSLLNVVMEIGVIVNIIAIFAEGWDGQPTSRDWYLIDNASHSSSDNWIIQGWMIASSWVRYTIVGRYIYDLITFYTILNN